MTLSKWPLLRKPRLVASTKAVFRELFYGKGATYWSPSGGSTGSGGKIVALPTALSEMHIMRAIIRETYVDSNFLDSNSVCVNLMGSGYLNRAMEVQGEIFVTACATHLPLGADASDDVVCDVIDPYGANIIASPGSRLVQLAIYCQKKGRRLNSVSRILRAGESISEVTMRSFAGVWGHDVQCYAVYGSSETGAVALRRPGETTYSTFVDGVHCEILDHNGREAPMGTFGTIVHSLASSNPPAH